MTALITAALIMLDAGAFSYLIGGWAGLGILWLAGICWLAYELARAPEE